MSRSCRRFQAAMLVGLSTYGPLTAISAMTFDSSQFPVAKLSLYSACSLGGEGGDSVWQMEEYVFVTFAQSITFESIIL